MTTAKNRALNAARRARLLDRKHEALAHETDTQVRLEDLDVIGLGAELARRLLHETQQHVDA